MEMRVITCVWACLVYTSSGRTVHVRSCKEHQGFSKKSLQKLKHAKKMRQFQVPNGFEAIATLLLSFNSQLSHRRCRYGHASTNCGSRVTPHCGTMRLPWSSGGVKPYSKASERRSWRRDMRSQILLFAGPALSTCLADPLMSVVDACCCGRFSTTLQLASLGPSLALFTFLEYLFFFLNSATADQVSKALANKDDHSAKTALSNALFVALSSGVAISALIWIFAAPLVAMTGCVPELIPTAAAYARIRGIGQPLVLGSMVLQAGLLAQRDSITPLHAVLFACLVNIAGDLALVPKLGAIGAAWATLVSQVLCFPLLLFLSSKRRRLPIWLRVPDAKSLKPLLSASGPLMVFEMGMSVGYVMIQSLSTQFSVASTAAFQAIWSPLSFIGFSAFPLKQAAQVFLPGVLKEKPREVGGEPKSKEFFKVISFLASIYGVAIAIASALCAGSPALLTQDNMLFPIIRSFAPYVSTAMALLPFVVAFEGVLLGMGDLAFLAQCQILNVVVSIATLILTKRADMGVHGTWIVLIAFYFSRFSQAAFRILAKRPWQEVRASRASEEGIAKIPTRLPSELHNATPTFILTDTAEVSTRLDEQRLAPA